MKAIHQEKCKKLWNYSKNLYNSDLTFKEFMVLHKAEYECDGDGTFEEFTDSCLKEVEALKNGWAY